MREFRRGLPRVGWGFPSLTPLPLLKSAVDEAEAIMKSPRELIFFGALTAVSIAVQGLFDVRNLPVSVLPFRLCCWYWLTLENAKVLLEIFSWILFVSFSGTRMLPGG